MKGHTINLNGKTALIIGARAGIGKGIADSLRSAGCTLILTDVETFSDEPGDTVIASDFFNLNAQRDLFQELDGTEIDYLVCGPYVPHTKKLLTEMDDEDLIRQINGNLAAPLTMARRFIKHPYLGTGRAIVFVGSEFGLSSMIRTRSIAYDVSKAGLAQATRVLAKECIENGHGVRVNLIAPGATDTPGERDYASEVDLQADWKHLPAGRPCTPAEIGDAVRLLIAHEMINGEVLRVNGGEHLV